MVLTSVKEGDVIRPVPFLFASGVENSYPTLASGVRIDEMEKCGHYGWWEEDFGLARELRLDALRYGPAYYRTHVAPGRFDWDSADAPMERLRSLGIEVIADLCHFGVPSWLGSFQERAFPVEFADYARHFARRYPWVRYFTPVNEIFIAASFSALRGWWNECEASDATFVRALRNLCMAHELAIEALLSERPDAVIVQAESIEHFHATSSGSAAVEADWWNMIKGLGLDLTLGHELSVAASGFLRANGMSRDDLCFFRGHRAAGQRWLGIDYYPSCEHVIDRNGRHTECRFPLGLQRLASSYHERYGIPLFHSETSRPSPQAVPWLRKEWGEVLALMGAGVPMRGFTWYSLTDQVDWHQGLRVERNEVDPVGLFDLDRVERSVGHAYGDLIRRWHRGSNARPRARWIRAA
jgi:beta-glucosidase/6-phospho-beta-glucosidase/beta-galactosidase